MRNANRVWLAFAIIVCALAIAATAFAAYRLIGFEVSKPDRQALASKALRDLQKSDKVSVSVVSLQIPPSIAPQVYSLATGIGAGEKDIGFILFWDPNIYENADKLGREVVAVGISGGDYQGTVILQSPKGAVVASPKGLYTPDPPYWQANFATTYEIVNEAYEAIDLKKARLISDESFKMDFKKHGNEQSEKNAASYIFTKWHKVGYDRNGNLLENKETKNPEVVADTAKILEKIAAVAASSQAIRDDGSVWMPYSGLPMETEGKVILWGYGNKTYELSSKGLAKYDAHIDSVTKTVYASPMLPFAPPLLHLAILFGIFLVLLLVFVLGKYHDFALSSFSAFLAIVLAGGASLFLDGRIAPEIVPLASLIGAGIVWTVPVLFSSISFGLDLATGWYWLFFALLAAANVASKMLPPLWIWVGLEILLGLFALATLAALLMKSRKKATA